MTKQKQAVIIGAGAGGLGLANILVKAGYKVDVYEKNAGPGGRMGILQKKGFTFDTGPSWYLMKDVFDDYFKLFDKKPSNYYNLIRLDPAYRVFFDYADPITIGKDYQKNLELFDQQEPGAGAKLDTYLDSAEQNYQLARKYFLYNPFKSLRSVLRKDVLVSTPKFLSMFTNSLHNYVKKSFTHLPLQQILEYPSVFLGASPFSTPALYQLMSYLDMKEGVYYPKRDGMYAITKALRDLGQELGVNYHYGAPTTKILTYKNEARGIVVDGKEIKADIVISNADLKFTETKLLEKQHQTYPAKYWSSHQAGPSALLMYLGVSGSLPELSHHNLFFVKKWKQNFDQIYKDRLWPEKASIYVSKTTASDKSTAPKGHENVFVLVPLPSGVALSTKETERCADMYLDQIADASGIKDLKKRIVLREIRSPEYFGEAFNAWDYTALGMSHTLRQSAFLRPSVKSKKLKNLYYVGAGVQPGIGVPLCLISAQLVYKSLTGNTSAGTLKSITEITT